MLRDRLSAAVILITVVVLGTAVCRGQNRGGEGPTTDGERAPFGATLFESGVPWEDPIADAAAWAGSEGGWLEPIAADRLAHVRQEDATNDASPGHPYRVGVSRPLAGGPAIPGKNGLLFQTPEGRWCWRVTLRSEGALLTGPIFSRLDLVPGARVLVGSSDPQLSWASYELRGPMGQGFLYAPPVPGELVYVEYQGPVGGPALPVLEIEELAHLYRGEEELVGPRGSSCYVDVNCRTVEANARDSVGRMLFTSGGSQYVCSGALISDSDPNTWVAWFLTANHCISTQAEASTLSVRWRYQTSTCGGSVAFQGTTAGATLVSHGAATDFCLLRLANDVNLGQGIAGMSAGTINVTGTYVGVHHPGGSFKRFSLGQATATGPICETELPTSNFAYLQLSDGTTAGGSSGSPLFEPGNEWRVVGQLYGYCFYEGCAVNCGDFTCWNDVYGRNSVTYPVIAGWLNTLQTEDGFEPNDTIQTAVPIGLGAHNLSLVDYDDYFALTLSDPTTIQINVGYSETSMNLSLALYSSSGTLLQFSNLPNGTESITRQVASGTYIVRLSRSLGWGGNYTLSLNVPCLPRQWTEAMPPESPSPRQGAQAVFDSARSQVVLFGGDATSGVLGETWIWDGSSWAPPTVSQPTPSARTSFAMAYDAARGVTVLFGGWNGSVFDGDTWEWDGTEWSQRMVSGPSPRYYHSMVYDSARGVCVLFGGATYDGSYHYNNETWEWDGLVWTQRANDGPSPRAAYSMAYDAARGVTVLFGGTNATTGITSGDTWEWNGLTWAQRSANGPSPRYSHAMIYDTSRAVTVLIGGATTPSTFETWEWDGTTWVQYGISGPSSRQRHALAYDTTRNETMMFGGTGVNLFGDTWRLVTQASPQILSQPLPTSVCNGGEAHFSLTLTNTSACANTYTWRLGVEPVNLSDPRFTVTSSADCRSSTLTITSVNQLDEGSYSCVVVNECAPDGVPSESATLAVCTADFNCDSSVSSQDFFDFIVAFFNDAADINYDGVTTSQDFFDFLASFFTGC